MLEAIGNILFIPVLLFVIWVIYVTLKAFFAEPMLHIKEFLKDWGFAIYLFSVGYYLRDIVRILRFH